MPTVSEKDRAHFAKVAEAKLAEREDRLREALGRPPLEGIVEGLALGDAAPASLELELELDRRALGQAQLAMRGRRLGRRPGDDG